MKKLILSLALMLGVAVGVSARDTYAHDVSVLPASAKTILKANFKAPVSVVKIEKGLTGIKEYEVVLTDGNEVTFDKGGNWDNIETSRQQSVPSSILPDGIRTYVAKHHAGTRVVGIDRERSGYEVELSNGVDLKFDRNGTFLRYDD